MIHVGTSGFSYSQWKGSFYPEKLPAKDYLSFYAERFTTTEINNTFYRSPSEKTAANWAAQVQDSFRFTLKLNQKITHRKRLRDVADEMDWFLKGTSALGAKVGTLLVQLPPYFRVNLEALGEFLKDYARSAPLALEFRHPSWFQDDVFQLLTDHGVTLVMAETDEESAEKIVTASFLYIRLRKSGYSEHELAKWAEWIRSQEKDAFVYLKHDNDAPALATTLKSLLED